jgi:DNA-directed RNA polymerase specialized sigma24 family protein
MAAEGSRSLVRLNAVDRRGRKIEPAVLAAAEAIYPKALEHGLRLLGDPAVVTTALEEVAARVSRRLARTKDPPADSAQIRDLRAYLFEAFIRRVNELKRKELKVVSLSEISPTSDPAWADPLQQFDDKVLLDECLAKCDPVAREMAIRRMQGFSWEDVGKEHGLSAHAAEARFSYALQQARERLKV